MLRDNPLGKQLLPSREQDASAGNQEVSGVSKARAPSAGPPETARWLQKPDGAGLEKSWKH